MTMARTGSAAVDSGMPHLELLAIDWLRIQLVLRFRPTPDLSAAKDVSVWLIRQGPDGADVHLTHGNPAGRMSPTRLRWEGAELVTRFNVMQGWNQVPLEPGTWRLAASFHDLATTQGRAVAVDDPAGLADRLAPATFATPAGVYGIRTGHATGRGVTLEITHDRAARGTRAGRSGGLLGRARRVGRRLARLGFRSGVALVRRLTAGRRPAILFTSSTRPRLGGNLAVVHDRMAERGLLRDVDVLLSFRPDLHAPVSLRDRLRQPWLFGRAHVIVLDDFHPIATLIEDSRSWIVQLWHASGAVKTILYSRIGKPDGPDPWSRHYKNFRYAIVGAEGDVPHFAEAFGIPEQRVVATGIPRMDRFLEHAAKEAGREAALAAHPEARGRFVILFAPTFRGVGVSRSYDVGVLDYAALHALCVERDAVFVIRLHPRLRHELDIPEAFRDRLLDGTDVATDAPDILFATDLLITDYSSIIFEFATLGRPMLFFAPDLDTYREDVDFYEPYETLVPGRIVRTMAELVDAIRREDYAAHLVPAFAQRHLAHLDGQATDRVIDQLILPGLRWSRSR
jgi:CDP-ribitol ribitolphosphotransferase